MDILSFTFFYTNFFIFFFRFSTPALDTISPSQSISDGKTLVSRDGSFELGFFSPAGSSTGNRYLGIWYNKIPVRTVVWVANRRNPINDSSGLLMINSTANLVLLRNNKNNSVVVWSSNSTKVPQYPIVQLLDTGNLVLRDEKDGNSENYLWQSFDYPSDTLLPGMKLGWDLKTGFNRRLSAWKNADDPSPADFTWELVLQDNPESVIWNGSKKFYRSGPWNGLGVSGAPELMVNSVFDYHFVSNKEEVYYMYTLKDKSMISRIVLNQTTNSRQRYIWIESTQTWRVYAIVPRDLCDDYGLCGSYGNCIIGQSPICQCLDRFKPKVPEKWNSMDWSQGCLRDKPLNCGNNDGFVKYNGLKLPDAAHSWVTKGMNLKECRAKCLENCSCMAYTSSDIRGRGSGCTMWFDDLIDIRQFAAGGEDLYIRMSASESETGSSKRKKLVRFIVIPVLALGLVLLVLYFVNRRKLKIKGRMAVTHERGYADESRDKDLELPLFDLATIADITNNFSDLNKLGEGGYGPVYKGTLSNGQEIAVKRLSKDSTQGLNEFKNEVLCIANLQHRNLVKLLGCCIQVEEKMLIYEYMPNKSLDFFIFNQKQSRLVDWPKRTHIINGIARGLLYLHQDSRLRIIHRDLKASNILLDNEMNPKISDFGLARSFGGNETETNTKRVVGTYGYMSPEYAMDGLFSIKSDVFSFGVLVLEIVSGRRNRGFHHPNHKHNLLGHAWRLYKECRPMDLIDEHLKDSCIISEVLCSIHVSLLCVQQSPEDRPSMATVVLMLTSEVVLPEPKEPGFYAERKLPKTDSLSSKTESYSADNMSITLLTGR